MRYTYDLSIKNFLSILMLSENCDLGGKAIQNYIEAKKKLYESFISFIENSEEEENNFRILIDNIDKQEEEETKLKFEDFLELIANVASNHYRCKFFFNKIFQIINHYKEQITQTFSNAEIYNKFESNMNILLFLFKNGIIRVDDAICEKIEANGDRYCHFFYPEIKEFICVQKQEEIKNELLSKDANIFEHFEEKREKGENDAYICKLIQEDSIEEFVIYVNKLNISLKSAVKTSVFETNSFLIENSPTLIEYSAFFGSIQVFQYLRQNGVDLPESLWYYAIHSQNAELIHLLESFKVHPPTNRYEDCLIESIKCHHNNFAEYIENNLISKSQEDIMNEEIISNIMCYRNYACFPSDLETGDEFFYLCSYHYDKLVNFWMEKKKKTIKDIIAKQINIFFL